VYDYAMDHRELVLRKRRPVLGGYDPANYFSERIYARARDGMAIPISLVYRQGLERDGSAPCLLYAYGAYGATIDPFFSSNRLSLLDRGFVFAMAHVRGSGFLGEEWHDHGKLMEKKNTFSDVVAAAEHLVGQRYTSSERLGLEGGSAGGLLVGAVLNLRPDLFEAALAAVPFVDVINTMLDPSLPLTVIEFEEWGNPQEEEAFRYMLSYSPYENVGPKEYPHLLVTAGLNDARVSYWEPAKWVARLRAEKKGDHRLLLRTNMGAGHGGASGRYESLKEIAFEYAFLLDALGVEP
jgi:oligopeptidase B